MHTKFVIFVIIGSLLVATMHSSSTLFVFAELLTSCENLNETKAHCTVTYGESYQLGSDCTKNPDGTYSCTQDQDEDHDNNDTTAKTPSAPDPIPIPYLNTNNTTKAQIATD